MQDVVIIGGSFAGLTAALQLGRAGRAVTVIDAGKPRNRRSPAAHGVPGWDGQPPDQILARFAADTATYPTLSHASGHVTAVEGAEDDFTVSLGSGDQIEARRILLAHGVSDILPDLPGIAEVWGTSLLHCPYCHGYEVRNRPLALLANHAMSAHQARLLRTDWSDDVTLLTGLSGAPSQDLPRDGFKTDPRTVTGLTALADGIEVSFAEGAPTAFAAVYVAPTVSLAGRPADMLGCATCDGPLGPYVHIGPVGQTSVRGVFAAGDCARPGHNVTGAVGDGATAGIGCHQSLVFPEMIHPVEALQ